MRIAISSGHGKYVRGASGYIDEVDEARRVVNRVAELLNFNDVPTVLFHDNTSQTQSENLDTIVNFHNNQTRDLDVSVHFNAYVETSSPMGTECLYVTQDALAGRVSEAISSAGPFINRGPKYRSDLAFLNGTEEPAILIETCFVDSLEDTNLYRSHFDAVCVAIAQSISGHQIGEEPDRPPRPERPERPDWPDRPPPDSSPHLFQVQGRCSWFGGPNDTGVSSSEGLAFFSEIAAAPHLFLPEQPVNTTGLARRLNPYLFYVACRWDYDVTPKSMLAEPSLQAVVKANGREFLAWPADWGPHEDTGRVADLSPALLEALGLETDGTVEVFYPAGSGFVAI